ncbi:MAG: DMT family transporter [Spirochaetaceae bacterium]|jgi:drug/metabolite transporter (DMT)-like permease|nr:DMT family transporter [Spirochaetaceae bacterium]
MNAESIKGHFAAIITNVIFGLNIVITKSLLSAWMTPLGYTTTRMLFGLMVFWLIALFIKKEKVERNDLVVIAFGGLLGMALTQTSFSIGISLITPVTWSLIVALNPIGVLLLSILFLKETVSIKKVIGILIGISGALLIIIKNGEGNMSANNFLGICLAFFSVLSYASYIVITRKTSAKYMPTTIMKWMFLSSALVIVPFGIPELSEQRLYSSAITIVPVLQLGFALLFSSLLAFFLMPVALKRIKATTTSIYINLQPLVSSLASLILGQDTFTWDKPLALLLIIGGIVMVTNEPRRK